MTQPRISCCRPARSKDTPGGCFVFNVFFLVLSQTQGEIVKASFELFEATFCGCSCQRGSCRIIDRRSRRSGPIPARLRWLVGDVSPPSHAAAFHSCVHLYICPPLNHCCAGSHLLFQHPTFHRRYPVLPVSWHCAAWREDWRTSFFPNFHEQSGFCCWSHLESPLVLRS